jgi:excisionase family DNA binding protein
MATVSYSAKPLPATQEPLIGAKEAAKLLNCSRQTLQRRAERKEVPAMKIGNRWMFLASLLDTWRREKLLSNCSDTQEQKAG